MANVASGLRKAGATDTAYAKKLNQTIESFNLNQYDDIETKDFDLEETLPKLGLSL